MNCDFQTRLAYYVYLGAIHIICIPAGAIISATHALNFSKLFVTRFKKMCIIHKSDFAHLKAHKMCLDKHKDPKFAGVIEG